MTADLESLTIDATLAFPPLMTLSEVNRTRLVAKIAREIEAALRITTNKGEACVMARRQIRESAWHDSVLGELSDGAFRELTHWMFDQREAVT